MQNSQRNVPAPCIVNEGILINRTDMMRTLETLEGVKYSYIVDGDVVSKGEGVVVKVFSNPEASTLVVNGCLFLNILSFNYVHFWTEDNGVPTIELVEDTRTLQLTPVEDDNRRMPRVGRELFPTTRYDEGTPAEMFDELDDEDRF